jgi:hypothetical protein
MLIRSLALLFTACLASLAADSADRTIYRCVIAGVTTFSDRPCGDSIEIHSLDIPTAGRVSGDPPPPAVIESVHARVRKAHSKPVDRKDSQAVACIRLGTELRQLAARMRAGYSIAVGERLRDQQRAVRARRQDLHCR